MATANLKAFWSDLRRRKVVRVAIVYAVVAWVVIEAASVILPGLLLPEWSIRLVLALALIGFPFALVLAWVFDLSSAGLRRELPADTPGVTFVAEASEADLPRPSDSAAAPAASRRSIAVLPMANMSGDPENEYFSDGISEEIISLLARLPDLRVVSRTSSFLFKRAGLDVRTIAAKLGVNTVLEGSVRRVGNRVRIVAQLIDAVDDTHLWSDSYDRELEDIFAVQTDIARRIVDAMNLSPEDKIAVEATTESIPAYDYYLRGRQYLHQQTGKSLYLAREMFNKALEIDPGYVRAYAGAACAASLIAQWVDYSRTYLREAEETSRRALELAPDLAEGHAARGFALSMNGEYAGAAEHFERAIKLDPQLYEAWYLYGRSRFAEGNLEHAERLWDRAHAVQPEEFQSAELRVLALRALGRSDETKEAAELAVKLIERRLDLNPQDLRALGLGSGAMIASGRTEQGLAMVERSLELAPDDATVLHNAACAYAHAGDGEKALELMERRLKEGGTMHRDWLEHDSDFDCLRDDPRFIAILNRLPSASGR
ncbi:MAG TPA: tetratricopeptide repeat protein [Gammaproteobacteria bacterium]|nr:tetratricopeptide repeat protein [Gammaproteobacteria bacterium]